MRHKDSDGVNLLSGKLRLVIGNRTLTQHQIEPPHSTSQRGEVSEPPPQTKVLSVFLLLALDLKQNDSWHLLGLPADEGVRRLEGALLDHLQHVR